MRRVWDYFFGPGRWDFSDIPMIWRVPIYAWMYFWAGLFLAGVIFALYLIAWAIATGHLW